MKDEMETTMRLLGVTNLSQCSPEYLNVNDVEHLIYKDTERVFPAIDTAPKTVRAKL